MPFAQDQTAIQNHSTVRLLGALLCVLLAISLGKEARASVWTTDVLLEGGQVVPPVGSPATGSAHFEVDTDTNTLSYDITFDPFFLLGAELEAHIHGMAISGTNAGDLVVLPPGSPKVGTWNYAEGQEADILAGMLYVDIHTTAFPGGEIRAQVDNLQLQPLTRADAIAIVESAVISSSPFAGQLVGFLYNQDSPTDSVLAPGIEVSDWDSTFAYIIPSDSYFFWLDNETDQEWTHSCSYVFVDQQSGAVTQFDAETWPVVDGQEIARFTEDGNDSGELFHGIYQPQATVISDYVPVTTSNTKSRSIIVVGRNRDGESEKVARKNDIELIEEVLNGGGTTSIPTGPGVSSGGMTTLAGSDTTGTSIDSLCAALDRLAGEDVDKLYLWYIGHGKDGGIVLLDPDGKKEILSYDELARKLLRSGVKEVCVMLETCHSGSALNPFQQVCVLDGGETLRWLKGSVIASSPSSETTSRAADGAPFNQAINQCYKDKNAEGVQLADLNFDGKVTLNEAVAWARSQNSVVNHDDPRGATLHDGSRVGFGEPNTFSREIKVSAQVTIGIEIETISIKVDRFEQPDSIVVRQRFYIKSGAVPLDGSTKVNVYCRPKKGAPYVVLADYPLKMGKNERRCVVDVQGPCTFYLKKASKPSLASIADNDKKYIDVRTGVYKPGEFIFHSLSVGGTPGDSFSAYVDPLPQWGLSIDPPAWLATAPFETTTVHVRGIMPGDALAGATLTGTIVNQTIQDTTEIQITALVHDSLGTSIGDGATIQFRAQDVHGNVVGATSGSVSFDRSIVTFKSSDASAFSVGTSGTMNLTNTAIQPESTSTYSAIAQGTLNMDNSSFHRPADGLHLVSPTAFIRSGRVIQSEGDGLVVEGDLSGLDVEFFEVDTSVGNGLVANDATNALLDNLRINASGLMDVVLTDSSQVELLDATFDDTKVSVGTGSQLTRSWTTYVAVFNAVNTPLNDALVEVRDTLNALVDVDSTEADGFTERFVLDEWVEDGVGRTLKTPHQVYVSFMGADSTISFDAVSDSVLVVVLQDAPTDLPTVVEPGSRFALWQNGPNPFGTAVMGGTTTIRYSVPHATELHFRVFDVRGRVVDERSLGRVAPGLHRIELDAKRLGSGIYWYELRTPQQSLRRKMVVVK